MTEKRMVIKKRKGRPMMELEIMNESRPTSSRWKVLRSSRNAGTYARAMKDMNALLKKMALTYG
jgi:hypothetical protein